MKITIKKDKEYPTPIAYYKQTSFVLSFYTERMQNVNYSLTENKWYPNWKCKIKMPKMMWHHSIHFLHIQQLQIVSLY